MNQFIRLVIVTILLSFAGFSAVAQVTAIYALPYPEGARSCTSEDVNASGIVLVVCDGIRSFLWSPVSQALTEIESAAFSKGKVGSHLNDRAEVVVRDGTGELYIWSASRGATAISLPDLKCNNIKEIRGFNDLGEVAVQTNCPALGELGVIRSDGSFTSATPLAFLDFHHLNNRSQVLIQDEGGYGIWFADTGLVTRFPSLGGGTPSPLDLNDAGEVLFHDEEPVLHVARALLLKPGIGYVPLLIPAGYEKFPMLDRTLDNAGQVTANLGSHPVFWKSPDSPLLLDLYEQRASMAVASNTSGLVAGNNVFKFRLDGSPEFMAIAWQVVPAVPQPVARIEAVQSGINALLASGELADGEARSLSAKLTAATKSVENGETPAAKNMLQATSNQVSALEKSKRISTQAATDLRALIEAAISSLG